MQNLSDNELDDVFRKAAAASEQDTGARASDWASLAGKLEHAENVSPFWYSRVAGIGLTAFVVSTISLSILLLNVKPTASRVDPETYASSAEETKPGEIVSDGPTATPSSSLNSSSSSSSVQKPFVSASSTASKSANLLKAGSVIKKSTTVQEAGSIRTLKEDQVTVGQTEDEKLLALDLPGTGQQESESDTLNYADVNSEPIAMDEPDPVREYSYKNSSVNWLAVKATVAPDFSSIGFSSVDKVGWNYGVLVEVHFRNRISIAAGALRSRKFYTGTDLEYNGYSADKLNGDCRMWDLPVNVYYHFPSSKRWSFYSGIGISSYIMSREQYIYYVNSYYGTYRYEQEIIGKNKEWFKVLNISMGIQKRLDDHFIFQLEPYLKAPLAGVGEGDVSLASFGAFISLKYFIPRKSKP